MKKIIITGAKGTIGTVLRKGLLKEYSITGLDLPEFDVRDYQKLLQVFPDHNTVIHLAWDTKTENEKSERINSDNCLMTSNVYQATLETKIKRVIMASSVHADEFLGWKGPGLLKPDKIPTPANPYGANKVFMEALGRYYAKYKGLEVICIRFGWVNPENLPNGHLDRLNLTWLSHQDCIDLVKKCIEAKEVSQNFCIIYGVSNNSKRVHNLKNPFGWIPKDGWKL